MIPITEFNYEADTRNKIEMFRKHLHQDVYKKSAEVYHQTVDWICDYALKGLEASLAAESNPPRSL